MTKTCDKCIHKYNNECRLNPPVPIINEEWIDAGNLGENLVKTVVWKFPPTIARCGQYELRIYPEVP